MCQRGCLSLPTEQSRVEPISLAIEPGEQVLITGPSGCGKSTLVRCLTGLIPHLYHGQLEGEIWLDGLHTIGAPMWQLAERAGLVFQNPAAQMLAQSVEEEVIFGLENLGLPRNVIRERLESTLEQFGLGSLRRRSPQTLSGGEQQKLALVATMARYPTVLVMDEPLSMLDGTAANELVEHATDLADAGATVIVCEHREEYLEAVPGLYKVNLDGLVVEEVAIPELEPHLFGPQADKLEVQGLTCSAGRVAGRADAESVEASWLFRLSG